MNSAGAIIVSSRSMPPLWRAHLVGFHCVHAQARLVPRSSLWIAMLSTALFELPLKPRHALVPSLFLPKLTRTPLDTTSHLPQLTMKLVAPNFAAVAALSLAVVHHADAIAGPALKVFSDQACKVQRHSLDSMWRVLAVTTPRHVHHRRRLQKISCLHRQLYRLCGQRV